MLLQHAKIYQIINDKGQRYVGSTTRKYLTQRFAEHKYSHNQRLKGKNVFCCSSTKVLQHPSARMEILESFPCDSVEELKIREQFYMSNLKDVVNLRSCYQLPMKKVLDAISST